MRCFLFLVETEVDEGKILYHLDAVTEIKSYRMMTKPNVNPYDEYLKRSNLIGKDHKWSIQMEKYTKTDSELYTVLNLRTRMNARLTMHSVKIDSDSFDRDMLEVLFQSKIDNDEIVPFLKDSKL